MKSAWLGRAALACALALTMPVGAALAQGSAPLPPGNVSLLVPFPAGGPLDVVARLFADKVATRNNRPVVVENRPGAAGNVGASALARAEPNGLTWMMAVDNLWTVNPHLGGSTNFDLDKDIAPVGQLGKVVLMLAVHPKVPANTWAELLAHSKSKSLNFGSAGIGSPGHLALEYLKMSAPFNAAHVPFRGAAPTTTELLAGNIDGAFIVAGVMLDYVQTGKIRALAISDSRRMEKFPAVPTAMEAGIKGFEASFTNIVAVPAKTPAAVRAFIAAEMRAVAAMPDVRKRMDAVGSEPIVTGEDATRKWIAEERERWGKVAKARGLKAPPPPTK